MSVPNTTPPRLKLRWYQFSLRALLGFITLAAVVLSAGQILGWRLLIFLVACSHSASCVHGRRGPGGRRAKTTLGLRMLESLATVYGPLSW